MKTCKTNKNKKSAVKVSKKAASSQRKATVRKGAATKKVAPKKRASRAQSGLKKRLLTAEGWRRRFAVE